MRFNKNLMNKKSDINLFYRYLGKSSKMWTKNMLDEGYNKLNQKMLSVMGSGIMLTNNEIENIKKIIKSPENRGIIS